VRGLVGTVAGDDTLFIVADSDYGARKLANDLRAMAGLAPQRGTK
jgi:arginine repressor